MQREKRPDTDKEHDASVLIMQYLNIANDALMKQAEQKIKYHEEIGSLRTKQQHMHEKLDDLRAASEDAWEEVETGVELAWQDLQDAFERAVEKFK